MTLNNHRCHRISKIYLHSRVWMTKEIVITTWIIPLQGNPQEIQTFEAIVMDPKVRVSNECNLLLITA